MITATAVCENGQLTITIAGATPNARTTIMTQTHPRIARGNLAGDTWSYAVPQCEPGARINGDTGATTWNGQHGYDDHWHTVVSVPTPATTVDAPPPTKLKNETTTSLPTGAPSPHVHLGTPLLITAPTTTVLVPSSATSLPNTGSHVEAVGGAGFVLVALGMALVARFGRKVR